jgi:hypothetical protein
MDYAEFRTPDIEALIEIEHRFVILVRPLAELGWLPDDWR